MNPLLLRDTIGMAQGGAPTQVGSGMGGLGAMLGMLLPQLGAALLGTPGAQQVANLVSKMAQDQLVQQYINRKMIDPNAPAPFGITPEQRLMAEGLVHTRRMEALEQQGMELQKTQSKRQGEQFDWQKQMANEQMLREGLRQDEEARRFNEEMELRKKEQASSAELRKGQQELTAALYGARAEGVRTPEQYAAIAVLQNPYASEEERNWALGMFGYSAPTVTPPPPPPVGGAGGTTGSAGPAAGSGTFPGALPTGTSSPVFDYFNRGMNWLFQPGSYLNTTNLGGQEVGPTVKAARKKTGSDGTVSSMNMEIPLTQLQSLPDWMKESLGIPVWPLRGGGK